MAFTHLLVPIDGSEPAQRALQYALQLSAQTGATVELVAVLDISQLDFYDGMYRTVEQVEHWQQKLREQVLDEARAQIPAHGARILTTMLKGSAARAILEHIDASGADGIVMGRTGRGKIDRMLHGSVSRRVSALSTVPVTLVP